MSRFNLDLHELTRLLLLPRFRKPKMLAWLRALMAPLADIVERFTSRRAATLYKLAHSGQVVRLEAVLNDTFDPTNRGIIVTDAPDIEPTLIARTAELKPLLLSRTSENKPVFLSRTADVEAGGPDFLVQVPASVVFDEAHMRATIDYYRIGSKYHYIIETI